MRSEAQHRLGRFDLQVGVEMRQLPRGVVDDDEGAVSCCRRSGGTENLAPARSRRSRTASRDDFDHVRPPRV